MDKLKIVISFKDYQMNKCTDRKRIRKEVAETIVNQSIYHNDLGCYLWSFDYKLPCGAWCENIVWRNDLNAVKCLVCI